MAIVLPNGRNYFTNSLGAPLIGGRVYTYIPGTSTPKATYTTSAASTPNANPVVLDVRGEAAIYWTGAYDVVLKDASDVTIWGPERLEESATGAALDALTADLASTTDVAKGDALVGVKRAEGGGVATTQHAVNQGRPIYATADAGCVADGTTDDRAALANADTMAGGTKAIYLPPGTYKIDSNITISSALQFAVGAKLKPANGVTVTLSKDPQCPVSQVFDVSLGGVIAIPIFGGEAWADWWGAIADGTTDSTAAIQAAANMLIAPDPDGSGGRIRFTQGSYIISDVVTVKNRVVFRGAGFFSTEIKASAGFTATRMIEFKNGTGSQFGCRLEELQINCNDKSFSSGAVYAPSWNEHCGIFNVHIRKLGGGKGIYVDNFYGGSAQHEINQLEVVGGATIAAGSVGVHLVGDPGITVGWNAVQLKQISVTNAGTAANLIGIQLENRLLAYAEALHFEECAAGLYLLTDATVSGARIQGGPGCTNLIDISAAWTGSLHLTGVKMGNASKKVFDRRAATYTYFENEDTPDPLIFPPDPGQVMAAARCTGGATPVVTGGDAWAKRISGVSRNGVGSYRFTLSPAFGAAAHAHAFAIAHQTGFRAVRTVGQTASTFDVVFEDPAGAAVETTDFTVWVTHKP